MGRYGQINSKQDDKVVRAIAPEPRALQVSNPDPFLRTPRWVLAQSLNQGNAAIGINPFRP